MTRHLIRTPITFALAAALLATGLILDGHAIAPASTLAASRIPAPEFVSGRILVRFRSDTPAAEVASLEKATTAREVGRIDAIDVRILNVPLGAEDAVVTALSKNPAVAFAERDAVARATNTPNDPWWPNEWGPVKTRSPQAWDLSVGAPSVVVAVLDTGIDFTQPDLQGKTVAGWDVVNNDSDPTDDNGHGTNTAGIVSAATNNATGVAAYCWTCAIMPVKVLGSNGSGSMSNVAAGVTWATDHGARVINMSLGGTTDSSTLASAVSYAHSHGVVIVAAAGNYGTTSKVYPAAEPYVIGVAATDSTDTLYTWSTYGSWVKLAAPGCNLTTGRSSWYGTFCGTSSSAPAVAGIAGLAAAYAPGATNTQIEGALESTAVNIGSVVAYGRIDAYGALQALGGGSSPSPTPAPSPTPTPTPAPTPAPTPSPTPTPTSTPSSTTGTTTTASYRGSLSSKQTQRAYGFTVSAGTMNAAVDFSGPPALDLTIVASDGTVIGHVNGGSVLTLATAVQGSSYTVIVSDDGTKANFRLTVSYPSP